jgi:simple sugar transport system ATP-binding protein
MTSTLTAPYSDTAVLQVRGVSKSYGHVEALRGVDLDVPAGQVTALIGDNGAGKSTLIKILSGTEQPDDGQILLHGALCHLSSPIAARAAGLETVFQDLALAPDLDAAANLFLGRELRRRGIRGLLGWLDKPAMRKSATDAFTSLGVAIKDVAAPIASYSGGQRQGVAVARSAHWAKTVLLLDEPTAALGVVQTRHVLDLIRRIRDTGIAVILVSHSMPDVLAVSDRISVLRLGRRVADLSRAQASTEALIAAMTGLAEVDAESDRSDNPDDVDLLGDDR